MLYLYLLVSLMASPLFSMEQKSARQDKSESQIILPLQASSETNILFQTLTRASIPNDLQSIINKYLDSWDLHEEYKSAFVHKDRPRLLIRFTSDNELVTSIKQQNKLAQVVAAYCLPNKKLNPIDFPLEKTHFGSHFAVGPFPQIYTSGNHIIIITRNLQLKIYDYQSKTIITPDCTLIKNDLKQISDLIWLPEKNQIIYSCPKYIKCFDFDKKQFVWQLATPTKVAAHFACSPNKQLLAVNLELTHEHDQAQNDPKDTLLYYGLAIFDLNKLTSFYDNQIYYASDIWVAGQYIIPDATPCYTFIDDKTLLYINDNGFLCYIDLNNPNEHPCIIDLREHHKSRMVDISYHEQAQLVAITSSDKITMWRINGAGHLELAQIIESPKNSNFTNMAISASGSYIAIGESSQKITILRNLKQLCSIKSSSI
jgi:WD40 repeat protein